jgi:RNA polymerase sigma-70 factor, ECF subfamily
MRDALERIFLDERTKLLASLIRFSRNFDDAQDALTEAFLSANQVWATDGLPQNPGAWLLTTAKRKLLDQRRIAQRRQELLQQNAPLIAASPLLVDESDSDQLLDDPLRLIFTCCHPVLSAEARIALTLKILGGLTTLEIAKAFLVDETTMAQRLVRAKKKIALAGVRYAIPSADQLSERLSSVLQVLLLIFNEGYKASAGASLERRELCEEAMRLARLLNQWMPQQSEVKGLLALMILTYSRRYSRIDGAGHLVTLDQQDRRLWRQTEILEGVALLEVALQLKSLGPYQLHAAIMALHCEASTADATDWSQIELLYRELLRFDDSPIVRLNHAVAVGYADDWQKTQLLLQQLTGLEDYYPFHAVRAHVAKQLGLTSECRAALYAALSRTENAVERDYLSRRIAEI